MKFYWFKTILQLFVEKYFSLIKKCKQSKFFIILLRQKQMFPQIIKNKKKVKIGTEDMIKECQDVMKQLDLKYKKVVKLLPNELVSDFHKVCRLKDINPFYAQYFFYFIQKASKQQLERNFSQQVQNIMLGKSSYQKIQTLLKQRSSIVTNLKEQLLAVEGFSIMNSGKNVPHTLRNLINSVIKDCSSLQQVKKVQGDEISKLAQFIQKLRQNLKEIVEIAISWEYKLKNFNQNQNGEIISIKLKNMKVIYPENGVNCIFHSLYDTQFLKSSFLAQELKFLGVEYDPFLLYIEPTKKTNKLIEQNFIKRLKDSGPLYKNSQIYIFNSIPGKKQIQEQQQKLKKASKSLRKFYNEGRPSSQQKNRSSKKLKEDFLNTKIMTQSAELKGKLQKMRKLINIDDISNAYKRKQSRKSLIKQEKHSIENQNRIQRSLSKSLSRSKSRQRSIQSLDKSKSKGKKTKGANIVLLEQRQATVSTRQIKSRHSIGSLERPKSMSNKSMSIYKNEKNENNKNQRYSRIQSVYQLSKGKRKSSVVKVSRSPNRSPVQQISKILDEKQQLKLQLSKQKKQQQTLKKIIKRVQNRTSSQTKLYENKMSQYEKQIDSLKNKIKQRQKKYEKTKIKQLQKQKQLLPENHNKLIQKVYQRNNRRQIQTSSPQKNLAQSKLYEQQNANKLLQNKIRQLNRQKLKLQKLIQKQGSKVNKEKQLYERKLQKYQQIISQIKNQAYQSKKSLQQVQKKYSVIEIKQINNPLGVSKDERLLKLYSKRQTISPEKLGSHQPSSQKKLQKNIMVKKVEDKRVQQNFESQKDLKIINSRNRIQIVYNANKRSKKQRRQSSKQPASQLIIKQKQKTYFDQMSKLQRQKLLLQRKLDLKLSSKSGTQVVLMKKLQQSQQQLQKYREIMQKQKVKGINSNQKLKQLRRKINQEYQLKLQKEKDRFEDEKQHLYIKLKQERQSKMQKDKYLSKQMIFLKEMQMRENQLIQMIQNEKLQREKKQRQLEQEIQRKEQILQEYQLDEIKRIIQKQVRQQMGLADDDQNNEERDGGNLKNFQLKKEIMEKQIRQMIEDNDYELQEIDENNEQLKQLIEKIKEEQKNIIKNLQADVELDSSAYAEKQNQEKNQLNDLGGNMTSIQLLDQNSKRIQTARSSPIKNLTEQKQRQIQSQFERNQSLLAQLNHKSRVQLQKQKMSHSRYQAIEQSTSYKQRQKIQNIVEHYLRNPHTYPENKSIVLNKQEQSVLIQDLIGKSRKAKQFQQQLMDLRNVQSFVPAERDDPITNHMLSLREAYQHEQAQSLRRILWPSINYDDRYGQNIHELSFQSQQPPPPVSILDHVKIHEGNYLQIKRDNQKNKKGNKNFMAINRMKLQRIQQEKRQKQRQLVEDEAKKKVRKIIYKSKKKQQKQLVEFTQIKNELLQKYKKRQEQVQRAKKGEASKSISKKQSKINNSKLQKPASISKISAKKSQKLEKPISPNQNKLQQKKQQQSDLNEFLMLDEEDIRKQQQNIRKSVKNQDQLQKQIDSSDKNRIKIVSSHSKKEGTQNMQLEQQKDYQQQKNQSKKQQQNRGQQDEQQNYEQQFEDMQKQEQNEFLPTQEKKNQKLQIQKQQLGGISDKHRKQEQMKIKKQKQEEQLKQKEKEKQEQKEEKQRKQIKQKQQRQQAQRKQKQQLDQLLNPPPSQNMALMLLQKQRQSLKSDLLSYQQQIRSYISMYSQFSIYQHFLVQKQLQQYVTQLTESLSSQQILKLNNNRTLKKDIQQAECLVILIAKDKETNLQIGIGVFHKQYQEGQYVCDYLLAHNMSNFLNLTFNFSRFIYQHDQYCSAVQYLFTITALQDQNSKMHFHEFQTRCKRLGEVYVKGKQSQTRKYVLNRELFEFVQGQTLKQSKGVKFINKIQIHEDLMKQKNQGFLNMYPQNYSSPAILLGLYLKNNIQELQAFKKRAQEDLRNRQLLLTAMIFAKKQFTLKSVQSVTFDTKNKIQLYKNILNDKFFIQDNQQNVQEMKFNLQQVPPKGFKRCVLEINDIPIPYCILNLNESLNQAQASNSAEIGTFLPLVPKYKVLIIPGGQFLTASKSNKDMNVFFYTKHFIKNITEVKKQNYSRVYMPEIKVENWTFYKNISEKFKKTVFSKEQIQIGFQSKLSNSIVYTPHHKDLLFEKPFIISVLSANLERAMQGSPIFCKLII